jgi:hypothetical protein
MKATSQSVLLVSLIFLLSGAFGCGSSSESTDTNTAAVVTAANTFLGTLSTSQLATVNLTYNATNAKNWSNIPISLSTRNGIQLGDLNSTQLTAALNVVQAALSTTGYNLFQEIRSTDQYISRINSSLWGSGKYYIAILGTPSTSSAWMLQVGGHHIAYNMTYHGTSISGTPFFVGTEPPNWSDAGVSHAPLETQRAAVNALAQILLGNSSAVISGTFTDVVMGPNGTGSHDTNYPQTYPTTGRGLSVSTLSTSQKLLVKTAIEAWVNTMPTSVSTPLLAAYESDTALNSTYVGLGLNGSNTVDFSANPSGSSSENSYLRIDGPRVWIEFVIQIGVAEPTQVHYHSLWRDKTTDYGAEF